MNQKLRKKLSSELEDCVALSGSASLIGMANAVLAKELKRIGKI